MNENSIRSLFEFIIRDFPRVWQDLVYYLFTPLRDILGDDVSNFINFINNILGESNIITSLVVNNIVDPILDVGLIGILSVGTLFMILLLKVIDLIVPI